MSGEPVGATEHRPQKAGKQPTPAVTTLITYLVFAVQDPSRCGPDRNVPRHSGRATERRRVGWVAGVGSTETPNTH